MNLNFLKTILIAATTVLVLASGASRADDTDIYFSGGGTNGTPLVFLDMSFRPSTGSAGQVTCTGTAAGDTSASVDPGLAYPGEACLHYFKRLAPTEFCAAATCTSAEVLAGKITGISDLFTFLRLSIAIALSQFQDRGIYIGLISSNNANNCAGNAASNCTNGGTISLGLTPLSTTQFIPASLAAPATNVTAQQAINAQLKAAANIVSNSNYSPADQTKEVYFELFRYLRGLGVYNGHNSWASFDGNAGGSNAINARSEHCTNYQNPLGLAPGAPALPNSAKYLDYRSGLCWDNTIESPNNTAAPTTATYVSPLLANCNTVTVINFLNGQVQADADSDSAIAQSVANGGMGLTAPSTADVVSAMYNAKSLHPDYGFPSVKSYFLGSNQSGPELPGLAAAGGTNTINYKNGDPTAHPDYIVDIISNLFQQVLVVSTSFVATAVPVNAFNKAQVLDSAYLALFKPDATANQRWNGTLKKLKITGGTFTDAHSPPLSGSLVIATDGRIAPGTLTFWTNQAALPSTGFDGSEATSTTDGRAVDRGGAGQKVPGFLVSGSNTKPSPGDTNATDFRNLFYDNGASLSPLNSDTTTAALAPLQTALGMDASCTIAGVTTPTVAQCTQQMLRWIRGQDVGNPSAWKGLTLGSTTTTAPYPPRPWLLGDPLHSRPLPLNYGATGGGYTTSNPAIYIAMGGNDGLLHFFEDVTGGAAQSGKELWAFMPKTVMPQQKTLALNTQTDPYSHGPYGVEGNPTAWLNDLGGDGTVSGSDTVYLYATMRRGGRAIYAINATNPAVPTMLWSIVQGTGLCNSGGCPTAAADYAQLGLSFSIPVIAAVRVNGVRKTVLVFGGGYDTNKDLDAVGSSDTVGNAIFIVDAANGSLIWKAIKGGSTGPSSSSNTNTSFTHVGMTDSIPSAISAVDMDGDGLTDRLITGDTGGNLWRVDIPGDDRSKWALTKIAKLGRWFADASGNSTKADDRRFFYPPDVVQTVDFAGTRFDTYPVGSGDREDPLDKGGRANNYFYAPRDNCTMVLSWDNLMPGAVNSSPVAACIARYPIMQDQMDDITNDCLQGQTNASANLSSCGVTNALAYGWKLQLNRPSGAFAGEKSLAEATTFFNVVYFTTYLPASSVPGNAAGNACGVPAEGIGYEYAVLLTNGSAAYTDANPTSGETPNNGDDRYNQLKSGGIPAQVVLLPTASGVRKLAPDLGGGTGALPPVPGTTTLRTFWQRVEETPP